jgi:hypothetical protein
MPANQGVAAAWGATRSPVFTLSEGPPTVPEPFPALHQETDVVDNGVPDLWRQAEHDDFGMVIRPPEADGVSQGGRLAVRGMVMTARPNFLMSSATFLRTASILLIIYDNKWGSGERSGHFVTEPINS